jgi:hypothetical protein
MRNISIIWTLLFLVGCQSRSSKNNLSELLPENSKLHNLNLVDSLGSISINLPNRYDTLFQWTNTSDCGKHCDRIQYRFQPKYLPVFKESGFYYKTPSNIADSTEQFTIVHSGHIPFHEGTDSGLIYKINTFKKENMLSSADTYKIAKDTVQKINDRYFSIITVDMLDSIKKIYSKKIIGTTTIKGNEIEFRFELLTKRHDSIELNFIKNSIDLIKTLKLSKGA